MKILFVTIAEKGHFHSMIGPAQALLSAGHDVAFYAPFAIGEPLARAGIAQTFAGSDIPPPMQNRGAALAAITRDAVGLRNWIRAMLLDTVADELPRLRRVVEIFSPAVIVADPMAYAVPIVAHEGRMPWVAMSSSLNPVLPLAMRSELLDTVAALAAERDALFLRHGLRATFRGCDCLSADLTLAFATPALVGQAPPDVTLVGSCLAAAPRGDEVAVDDSQLHPALPLVYFSLGSQNFYQPDIFARVVEAAANRAVQLVIAAGDRTQHAIFDRLPRNVLALTYAPQVALLARASAMITHAGANSVMESMAAGVPLLMSPLCNDQPHNAYFVSRAGAGVTLDLRHASPAQIWCGISQLLEEPTFRRRAAAIAQSYREQDGPRLAAEKIVALGTRA